MSIPKFFALACIFFISFSTFSQSPVQIPYNRKVKVDGKLKEWEGAGEIILHPDLEGKERERSYGTFGQDDLEVKLNFYWDEEALYAGISWSDDAWDTAVIPFDSARWGRRDRMYFYDNLVIRLAMENYFYGVWLAPIVSNAIQWELLRLGPSSDPTTREQISAATSSIKEINDTFHIEVALPWKDLQITPSSGLEMDLRLILPDMDCTELTLPEKGNDPTCIKYLAWFGSLSLGPDSK